MAQTSRPKQPLDVLQSMINGILIEVGRALRSSDKEGGKTLGNATRLRSFFPGAIDNFHQALDDLECDIVRAKAVFLRDLEELRAQRLALENPPAEPVEDTMIHDPLTAEDQQENIMMENNEPTPQPPIKEEETMPQEPQPEPTADEKSNETADVPKESIIKDSDTSKGLQGPSPPSSLTDANSKSNPVGLGTDTTATTDDPAPTTSGAPDSSIDSLFGIPDSSNNDGSDMNLDSIDFLNSNNAQDQNDFDLINFGDSQDFNMTDLQATNDSGNASSNTGNKQDDMFNTANASGGGDMMVVDMDLGAAGGDDSLFEDLLFFEGGDDSNTGGRNEMEHGEFDNAYFGLDD